MAPLERSSTLFNSIVENYWEYYRELEDDFLATKKYVSFYEENNKTFSLEYLKLFQTVCSEIDVIGKTMAIAVNPAFNPKKKKSILMWWHEIQHAYRYYHDVDDALEEKNGIPLSECSKILLGRIKTVPWKNFETGWFTKDDGERECRIKEGAEIPKWWSVYNHVKHKRVSIEPPDKKTANYSKANFENLVHAFAGLNILENAFLFAAGTQNDLDAFSDRGKLFHKIRAMTREEIYQLFAS